MRRALKQAETAIRAGDYEDALRALEHARGANPGNRELLLALGRAYVQRFREEEAVAAFEELARSGPLSAEECYRIACAWQENGMADRAEPALRMTTRLAPGERAPWMRLAQLEDRRHRVKHAARAVARALALEPASQDARCLAGHIDMRAGNLDRAETRLRELLDEPVRSVDAHWRACYYLGQLLDRTGRHPDAMDAFVQGKRLLQRDAKPHRARAQREARQIGQLTARLTREHIARWRRDRSPAPDPRKRAILCGHPRSGTTLLEAMLGAHPAVQAADEPPVFTQEVSNALLQFAGKRTDRSLLESLDGIPPGLREQWARGYAAQLDRWMRKPAARPWVVDKNPNLTAQLPIAASVFPEMRYVVMVRDPRDIILSCFMQPLPLNAVSVQYLTLEDAARHYVAVMTAWRRFRDRVDDHLWLEVRYRDLVTQPEQEARRVLDFLGLPWHRRVGRFHAHSRRTPIQSPSYGDITRPAYTHALDRWESYAQFLEPCTELLASELECPPSDR